MNSRKIIFVYYISIFVMALFFGCTSTGQKKQDVIYYPKLPAGIETLDEARNDLAALLNDGKSEMIIFYPKGAYIFSSENDVSVYKNNAPYASNWNYRQEDMSLWTLHAKYLPVYSDRIEMPIFPLYYDDLTGFKIKVEDNYLIYLPHDIKLRIDNKAEKMADDLFFIQQNWEKYHNERLAIFEAKAAEYRSLTIKPQVSEEQRKYIIQANASNQEKNYNEARELYSKAIEVDPTSYPGAYFNMALLSAQLGQFRSAIAYMKQYLLLEPEAQDARGAQDKIYEWERKIEK